MKLKRPWCNLSMSQTVEPCLECGERDCSGAPRFAGTSLEERMKLREAEQTEGSHLVEESAEAGKNPLSFGGSSAGKTNATLESFQTILDSCVTKANGHTQKLASAQFLKYELEGTTRRLYSVTTIAPSLKYGGFRTPVICDSFEKAKEIVEGNHGDIFELSYRLVVIEALAANWLYGHLREAYWYRWEGSAAEGGYRPIEVPPAYKGVVGFAIG